MQITFTRGVFSVTIRPYLYPVSPRPTSGLVFGKTQGGDLNVQRKGTPETLWPLEFENLTDVERNSLLAFWENTIERGYYTCTFTDVDAAEYTVRWLDDSFNFQQDFHNSWSGSITLRIES